MVAKRVLYQDVKPYDVPVSLEALRGPEAGVLSLPQHVYWGPDPDADLDTLAGVTKAYQAILREGTAEVQEVLLNKALLLRSWDELLLPPQVRTLWVSTFPELAA
jgi:hypothetical protein